MFMFNHVNATIWYPRITSPVTIATAANQHCSLEVGITSEHSTSSSPATRAGGAILSIPSSCVQGALPTRTDLDKMDVPPPLLVQLQQFLLLPIRFACGGERDLHLQRDSVFYNLVSRRLFRVFLSSSHPSGSYPSLIRRYSITRMDVIDGLRP